MLKIHLRDPKVPTLAIHYMYADKELQLTDDPRQVNCKVCLAMMKRAEKFKAKK